jgi:hypothetical protein
LETRQKTHEEKSADTAEDDWNMFDAFKATTAMWVQLTDPSNHLAKWVAKIQVVEKDWRANVLAHIKQKCMMNPPLPGNENTWVQLHVGNDMYPNQQI